MKSEVSRPEICLVVSLDVEEEGLFNGTYARRVCNVSNTACLQRLDPLCERGIRPTLFCAHSVFQNKIACRDVARLRDKYGAEIGAHLHHWNTPPLTLDDNDAALPDMTRHVATKDVPMALMAAKLERLFALGQDFQSAPLTSFRMGRWDLRRNHWPLLGRLGVTCDASIRPLHAGPDGPDHFDAPTSPYWVHTEQRNILEVPLTVTPLLPRLTQILPAGIGQRLRTRLRTNMHKWGVLALLPVYHPLTLMQAATRLYTARGGTVLSLTWHSSEMMPKGAPHIPDNAAVERLLHKITAWLDWLETKYTVRYATMGDMPALTAKTAPLMGNGDWTNG